ncbi:MULTISPECIES: retropepsin-like aspartic protease [unclassified Methylibium]|uniref:retropepsin-like aspartic protease family protein n=1 Tax=unclassified Methylibium TaxID=2633235 RepID=UPI0003F41497|nr:MULTISPECIES: retropepsin-like aspartic protease [unclassified Methylibium]EWS53631.1 clan AA aspartic protease [Methylibium sp. T29]EWS61373.1 clan AA aspartic protease [Methylibium sp. T29-B]
MRAALLSAVLILAAAGAAAQQPSRRVALSGSMGSRALLVIDGDAPRAVAVGSTVQGVKLLSVNEAQAVVEIDGRRQTLRLGEAAVNLGGAASAGSGTQITLSSDANGHFQAQGQINGRGVLFLVDTGATMVSMGQDEAERLGLAYKNGERIGLRTANGNTVGYRISLNTVRVGDVEVHNVAAVVQPQPMPFILLGNSFLTRFQMKRENDTLLLQRRY